MRKMNRIEKYQDIFQSLKEELKWKVSDYRTLMMISAMYVVNDKEFDKERFLNVSQTIKDKTGFFSTLNSQYRFMIAAMLDVRYDHPEEKVGEVLDTYQRLLDFKFGRNIYSYVSAILVINQALEEPNRDEVIQKGMEIYKGMQSKHLFLTSSEDFPLAILLGLRPEPVDELVEKMEGFYQKFDENGFWKGNELQFLSHILSLEPEKNLDLLVEQTVRIKDELQYKGIKIRRIHYPVLGMLAMLPYDSKNLEYIEQTTNQFNELKFFKRYKDINLMMASIFLISEKKEDTTMEQTNLLTTIETIIQAQQAAMIAGVAAVTAANASSSN